MKAVRATPAPTAKKCAVVGELVKPMKGDAVTNTMGQIAIYQTADGKTQIDVRMEMIPSG